MKESTASTVETIDMNAIIEARDRDARKFKCCGRPPTPYRGLIPSKRQTVELVCQLCLRAYDPDTNEQVVNWAWRSLGDGSWVNVSGRRTRKGGTK